MFLVTEPRERCFELFKTQNSQKFPGFCPWTLLGRAYSADPRLPSCTTVFLLAMLVEKPAPPKKLLDTALQYLSMMLNLLQDRFESRLEVNQS